MYGKESQVRPEEECLFFLPIPGSIGLLPSLVLYSRLCLTGCLTLCEVEQRK